MHQFPSDITAVEDGNETDMLLVVPRCLSKRNPPSEKWHLPASHPTPSRGEVILDVNGCRLLDDLGAAVAKLIHLYASTIKR